MRAVLRNPGWLLLASLGLFTTSGLPQGSLTPGMNVEVSDAVVIEGAGERPGQLMRLKDGALLLCGETASLLSRDAGRTWQAAPAIASGLVVERRDGSFYLLKGGANYTPEARTSVGPKPGMFYGKALHVPTLEALRTPAQLPWKQVSVAIERAAAFTGDDGHDIVTPLLSGPLLELEDGTLVLATYGKFVGDTAPVEGFVPTKGEKWFKNRTYLLRSVDGGASWRYFSTVAYDGKTGQESFCEPALVDVGKGELLAVMRTGRFSPLFQARSADGGKNWQQPVLLRTLGLDPQVVVMPGGMVACSFGWRPKKIISAPGGGGYLAAAEDYRRRYQKAVGIEDPSLAAGDYVMFSMNKGQTWTKPVRIAAPLTVGYTRLAATGTNSCLVLSQRLIIPGESTASILQKWERDWDSVAKSARRVFEARTVTVRSE